MANSTEIQSDPRIQKDTKHQEKWWKDLDVIHERWWKDLDSSMCSFRAASAFNPAVEPRPHTTRNFYDCSEKQSLSAGADVAEGAPDPHIVRYTDGGGNQAQQGLIGGFQSCGISELFRNFGTPVAKYKTNKLEELWPRGVLALNPGCHLGRFNFKLDQAVTKRLKEMKKRELARAKVVAVLVGSKISENDMVPRLEWVKPLAEKGLKPVEPETPVKASESQSENQDQHLEKENKPILKRSQGKEKKEEDQKEKEEGSESEAAEKTGWSFRIEQKKEVCVCPCVREFGA